MTTSPERVSRKQVFDAFELQFPFIRALSPSAREQLERELEWRAAGPTTQLVCRGDEVGGVFLVLSGTIRVYYLRDDGREGTLYFVDPGEACFLSIHSVLARRPYEAWAETDVAPVRFAVLSASTFQDLFAREPGLRQYALGALSQRVTEMMQLVEATAAASLESRLAAWLLERADEADLLAISQERIARHLGTAREVVVRLLRSLRRMGAIETERALVRIVDRAKLEALR